MKLPAALCGARVASSRHSTHFALKAPSLRCGRYKVQNRPSREGVCATKPDPTTPDGGPGPVPRTYRLPGRDEGSLFCERLIELAARGLGKMMLDHHL
jgi:hypothetical protein